MTTTPQVVEAGGRGVPALDVGAVRAELAARPQPTVLDVRTPGEFAQGRIPGAVNVPVDQLEPHAPALAATGGRLVLVCRSGARAARAAGMLVGAGAPDVVVLDGGMTAWTAAQAPVERAGPAPWALERQVRLVAGGIVAASVAGSVWAPRLRFVAGGIGVGLVTAALTDTCAMGTLLSKLPYNRRAEADVAADVTAEVAAALRRAG